MRSLTIASFEVGNGLIKSKIIMIAFCIFGIWLVWDFRLFGLFAYAALLFCISLSGVFETGVMPKSQEKKAIQAMYWTIFGILVFVIAIGFTSLLRPVSVAIAKASSLPSYYDNVVLLLSGNQEEVAQLLANAEFHERQKILSQIDLVGNAINLYYAVSIISLASSAAFVVFTSMCMTKSRLPHIDKAEISAMNARARVNVTHNLTTMRIAFCLGGLCVLGVFFLYFVTSRIGVENVGSFWGRSGTSRGNIAAMGLLLQIMFLFLLWNFARFPFGLKPNK